MNLHPVDQLILVAYLVAIVAVGFLLRRRAAESVEDYFLAGRRIHWIFISMSGSVTTYDISGTMWIVAMFYTMGLKGMWIHWSWGFLMPAVFMTFAGKWVRRSGVITGAEWMVTRFGTGRDARMARLAYAAAAIIFTVALVGYAFQGIGKFASVYLPLSETTAAILFIGVTSLYVILGGIYSVIFTDVLQTVILSLAALVVAVICYNQISYEALAAAAPAGWLDIVPRWEPEHLAETDYRLFGYFCIAWVAKGVLLNAGGPGQLTDFQRLLSTRSVRDSSKVGAGWGAFLITRWGDVHRNHGPGGSGGRGSDGPREGLALRAQRVPADRPQGHRAGRLSRGVHVHLRLHHQRSALRTSSRMSTAASFAPTPPPSS